MLSLEMDSRKVTQTMSSATKMRNLQGSQLCEGEEATRIEAGQPISTSQAIE